MQKIGNILFLFMLVVNASSCPTKKQANDCFFNVADVNNDNEIDRKELENSIYSRLGWFTRNAFKIFGGVNRIIDDCDENNDSILTRDESMRMESCLDSCFKRSNTFSTFECKHVQIKK
jgi:hypothetical protein